MLKNDKIPLSGDDFSEGLTAVISMKVPEPQFEGQTKTKLGNSEVDGIVNGRFSAMGSAKYIEQNPKVGKTIIEKVYRLPRHARRRGSHAN